MIWRCSRFADPNKFVQDKSACEPGLTINPACNVEKETSSEEDDSDDEWQFLTEPKVTEREETITPKCRFANQINYDLRKRIQTKTQNMVDEWKELSGQDMSACVEQIMTEGDELHDKQCEQLLSQWDMAGDRIAAGAVEIPIEEWMSDELMEEGIKADNREMDLVCRLRLRNINATEKELEAHTDEQKKSCLEMRMAHTQKRPTPEQEAENQPGSLKSRFVAKDLKVWFKEDMRNTHAEVPGMLAFRLSCARANLRRRRISSTDYDVAFMQAFSFKELGVSDILVKWYDYREKTQKWGFLEGPTCGQQICMRLWKLTHGQHLAELGFIESKNQGAVCYHPELDMLMLCHVDDPWIDIGLGKENEHITEQKEVDRILDIKESEMHEALMERFKTKGKRSLRMGITMDYLSMIVQTEDDYSLCISTDAYNQKILEECDMVGCNPASTPITKELLKKCAEDVEQGKFMDKEATRAYQKARGVFNWKSQTIGFDIAMANSLASRYNANPVESCADLVKHQVRCIAGIVGQKLRNHPESKNTLVVASDSDVAGVYSVDGETRSRGCYAAFYSDMLVDHWTGWIGNLMSSGQAETFTLSTALRRAMHVKCVGEEMGISMPRVITIYVDATVAMSFAADVGAPSGMKFIDMRDAWVMEMRDRNKCQALKIPTKRNPADFGTKLHPAKEFKRQRAYFLDTPKCVKSKRSNMDRMKNTDQEQTTQEPSQDQCQVMNVFQLVDQHRSTCNCAEF